MMVVLTNPWEQEEQHSLQGHLGMHWVSQKTEVARGKCGKETLLWFLRERTGEEGKAGLALGSLNISVGSGTLGLTPLPASDPKVIRASR